MVLSKKKHDKAHFLERGSMKHAGMHGSMKANFLSGSRPGVFSI